MRKGRTQLTTGQILIGGSNVNQTDRLTWNSNINSLLVNGNIGIGTTNPQSLLHLNNNNPSDVRIQLTDANSGIIIGKNINNDAYFSNLNPNGSLILGTSNTQRFIIDSNGRIGIGTNTDNTNSLNVNGNVKITGNLEISNGSLIGVALGGGGTGSAGWGGNSGVITTLSNVGIGTTGLPLAKLDVYGDTRVVGNLILVNSNNNSNAILSANSNGGISLNSSNIFNFINKNTSISATNASFGYNQTNPDSNFGYYLFRTNGTITFPRNISTR